MGLITEALCQRSIKGRALPDSIKVLAALNPYRLRPKGHDDGPGLVFSLGAESTPDPMAALVYRVQPIPPTLQDFIFDFGALSPAKEQTYIRSMVAQCFAELPKPVTPPKDVKHAGKLADRDTYSEAEEKLLTRVLQTCQEYIRQVEGDPSSASLRDVKRTLKLLPWFLTSPLCSKGWTKPETFNKKEFNDLASPLAHAIALSMAHVYIYRLASTEHRRGLYTKIKEELYFQFETRTVRGMGLDILWDNFGLKSIISQACLPPFSCSPSHHQSN